MKGSNRLSYKFELEQPSRVVFGCGTRHLLSDAIHRKDTVALVCGSTTLVSNGCADEIMERLECDKIDLVQIPSCEPTLDTINGLTEQLVAGNYSTVIGLGGGSTLDSVKACSVLSNQSASTDVLNYLEGVGAGHELKATGRTTILLPTTAGTGSEATKNAVIYSPEHRVKKSIRSPLLLPKLVIIDPELHTSCDVKTTTYSGMDAITQCFESYISSRSTAYTRTIALDGFKLGIMNIVGAIRSPRNLDSRAAMAHCAFNSGVSLANAGLGVAHGLSSALGVAANLSHGEACAILLPFAAKLNQEFCTAGYCQLANAIGLQTPQELTSHLRSLCGVLKIPDKLTAVGLSLDDLPDIVGRSYGNSMAGNPFRPEPSQLVDALISYYG